MSKQGHPLPDSDEARHNEIPEHLEREKGRGDDSAPAVQPKREAVNPDGEPYPYEDLGRGPPTASKTASEEFAADQAEHQDRGQSAVDDDDDGDR